LWTYRILLRIEQERGNRRREKASFVEGGEDRMREGIENNSSNKNQRRLADVEKLSRSIKGGEMSKAQCEILKGTGG
jgi:hypothetical protein